jgi:transcriptional regulator with XRE-family HTH domain
MISAFVKEARLAKGYTQKELADLSNISVRSIQRIENGEILPRSYTLKALCEILGVPFETMQKTETAPKVSSHVNKSQKIILSIGITLILLFVSWAFIAQSPRFPETNFEFFLFSAFVIMLITVILVTIWRRKS